ncbi:Low-affinity potassium transport protein [Penicillium oxalicum]|uniref:Low-affinity potassium transport protein n=1 Tax=Penicillium oxalicum TaxID=69781 RepID=UPI0020B86584|nr:Low-affinity potassium transport protein [Penicillium oxalicum]KAI2788098.1 Low-affinity potassium transport protein [Penicillium oxalicum]
MFSSLVHRLNHAKQQAPLLNRLHLNFIFVHYFYVFSFVIVGSIILYAGGNLAYIDALFFASGATTQSGLNTVDLNQMYLYQQIVIYFITMMCTPIFIHSGLVFVRLYWFEKRFQHVVQDARALRSTRSRMRTVTGDKGNQDNDRAERGIRGRSIVVIRNNAGDARGNRLPNPMGQPAEMQPEEDTTDGHPSSEGTSPEESREPTLERRFGLGSLRVPSQLSPEHHIAFLEKQRKNKGALRIPSPREYDRGGQPEALEDEEENEEDSEAMKQPSSPRSPRQHNPAEASENDQVGPLEGPHITINEPDLPRTRTRGNTFTRLDTRPTIHEEMTKDGEDNALGPSATRNTFRGIFRSLTQERERPTQPYLSWNATVARNSNFVDLTEEQRDELGGIEYRALKTLALVLITYYVGFHLMGIICMIPWIMCESSWGQIVTQDGVGRPWWAIFTSGSAFNDLGFTLTPDSMASFQTAVFPLLLFTFLIIIGNTGFPCMLRLMIWVLSKCVRQGSALWEELKFLLDHPRRCFTLLFPRNASWWLFAILVALNGIDLIFFIILDLNDPTVTALSPGIRVVDGLFQAASTRTAGFSVVSLSALHPAIQVSYLIMMYISVFPIAISMRRTNVYEEKSLGIYGVEEENDEETQTAPSYIGAHLRRQLSFDLWYVFLGLFIITIAEGGRLQANDLSFQVFTVLFEVVSAYGTVGLSFGYPGVNTSFSGQFNTVSKLVIIAMQIRGRHRGLPYSLDRAVMLPSDALNRHEIEESERRMRRRTSNLSGAESLGRPRSRALSQSQGDNGQSSGLDAYDWETHRASNGEQLVHRSSTLRSNQ